MRHRFIISAAIFFSIILFAGAFNFPPSSWRSRFVTMESNGSLTYRPDEKGNIIPDFSMVGYYRGDKEIPDIPVVKTITSSTGENSEMVIQKAIDEVSKLPLNKNGFRGTILIKNGKYKIPGSIKIKESGIVFRGEGEKTILIATGSTQRALISVSGDGNRKEIAGTRVKIISKYVPVGSFSFEVASSEGFKPGDNIVVLRPGNQKWISDLKMDQIEDRGGTKQWQPKEYDLSFERVIKSIKGNSITIDQPIVQELDEQYGGGEIFKYEFNSRISHVGVENLLLETEYESDTAENHAWDAIHFDKIENGWVRNITARYFGYAAVNLDNGSKYISVLNSNCFDAKSKITGSRRYSFNNTGQMNLFKNCAATDGRHDYVTGARVSGPNVFYNCTAKRTHADIGPHHRWAVGTLYDNIITDGDINIQDRGNWGSGHGWSGITQVLWNCSARSVTVQNPWVGGNNYSIGLKGKKVPGRLKGRPDGVWEGQNQEGLEPASLYMAQLKARGRK